MGASIGNRRQRYDGDAKSMIRLHFVIDECTDLVIDATVPSNPWDPRLYQIASAETAGLAPVMIRLAGHAGLILLAA
jgi:hypothetical protein